MPSGTVTIVSDPGIKRDGTPFDGNFYTDGQWVRWQRGKPRKIGGYRSTEKYLPEISRGLTNFSRQQVSHCHSGGASTLVKFIMDDTGNTSILYDRTPVDVAATGTVTLTGGSSGSVSSITVGGVEIMNGSVPFHTDLSTTAADVASSINTKHSSPDYTAAAVGTVVTITADIAGGAPDGLAVVVTATTITSTVVDMAGGHDALAVSSENRWMFDYEFDSSTSENYLLAHAAPNLVHLANVEGGQIFFGNVNGVDVLQSVDLPSGTNCAGGIVCVHPYLMYYGADGIIGWSVPGDPTNLVDLGTGGAGVGRPWGQKIIKGFPIRGNGSGPAAVFWAYDAVIRATFTGGETVFAFDVVTSDSSVMSPDAIVDYDGVFYWAGIDRFLMYNGVVREVPNNMNMNYFFDGINKSQRSKVFAFSVPRFGEIWWCYPRGSAEECTHAVIYNIRENTWYDLELPEGGRSMVSFSKLLTAPMLGGVEDGSGKYRVWLHEQGVDAIDGDLINPIQSYFETAPMSQLLQGKDEAINIARIEPDFLQTGPMKLQVVGSMNSRAPLVYGKEFFFPEEASIPAEQVVNLKDQRRLLRLRFESNALGGDYQMGRVIGILGPGDNTHLG